MASRLDLHEVLTTILGSQHVYFQPPESIKLVYPCIIYSLASRKDIYADDLRYKNLTSYTVTIIDKNPDSDLPRLLEDMKYCSFDREYTADNLHHFVYTLFY